MPKRTVELYLFDIVLSIDRVRRFSKQIRSVSTLMINEMLCSAVLRELGIIGEAMCHVLQEKKVAPMVKAEWRDVVNFRNIVVHEYFGLDFFEVFNIVKKDLSILEKEIIEILCICSQQQKFKDVFSSVEEELKLLKRKNSLLYLKKIKVIIDKKSC